MKAKEIHQALQKEFAAAANPEKAVGQQAYMKSSMPYWGVMTAGVKKIRNSVFKTYPPENNEEYRDVIHYLMHNAEYREEWYAAVGFASKYSKYMSKTNIDVYLDMILVGQWWDIIDSVSTGIIGPVLKNDPELSDFLRQWIQDPNMWVRRTALLTQLNFKEQTDFELQKFLILEVCHEKEFFIRKAIGWSLRQYSYTNEAAVEGFIQEHRDILSPLSVREGLKAIRRNRLKSN